MESKPSRRPCDHKGLEAFFRTGGKAGIQPHHADKLRVQLTTLDVARSPDDMNASGWRLHSLSHDLAGHWSVSVRGSFRLTFTCQDGDVVLVDYQDYH
ncbi:MAG: peptidase [Dokdonella sp.]|nr:MAG: peptidase [Dokdonella sp.]